MISSHRLEKDVVDGPERVEHRGVVGDHFGDAIVRDRDDRVDAGCQLGDRRVRDPSALSALERKRLGDDGDRQRALDAGIGSDDRRGAGTCAATQPGGDEDEIRTGDGLGDPGLVLLGGLSPDIRVAARAKAAGDRFRRCGPLSRRAIGGAPGRPC